MNDWIQKKIETLTKYNNYPYYTKKVHKLDKNQQLLKKCPHCKQWLPVNNEYYGHRKQSRSGFNNLCKKCNTEEHKKYRQTDNNIYLGYRSHAKRRHYKNINLPFELTREQFSKLIHQPCYYCGYEPDGHPNGVDRIDYKLGYTIKNSIPCCTMCNYMKGGYEAKIAKSKKKQPNKIIPETFLDHISKIYNHQKK